uniref:F-box domain-containing protein n=1 Tax=Romanomermis culicivorax TaxID=13658 RepID=A0A915ID82_ROMCU
MDDVVIITEILKYFNFEELCIAERINQNFKSCVKLELHQLRYIDFDRMFSISWTKILGKIQRYCSGLRRLRNLNNVLWKRPCLKKLTCLEIDPDFIEMFGWENALSFVENSRNMRQLSASIHDYELLDSELRGRRNKVIIAHSALMKLEIEQRESLDIAHISHDNVQLMKKLMRLPKLKTLSLNIRHIDAYLDEDLLYHRFIND